ncbi:periplasmic protein containing pyrroloquinoline quinone (PQQ) domain [Sulfurimonas gotlandica GD1]|uniref:Periplasmic protein containing pyrroloquinoline quinone (PQQ) domain n=1 Tax=Sulfurimonas gotlandica (strain DSM 19862 / JCM 16533 / GD1) TaxID=929558 RepID=B6BHH4_SULGG|nr:hypothetical protein [Sulfurimonas gotlandica]EDZ62788.1 PKD [Sulfurimonas gotlandica GD1]EHP29971.1 periplasmic protein containing pyrroloquinoline quinone (PQQ) domain [Sulfurimonas gotlandica GD1]
MKLVILVLVFASALLSAVIETNEGVFLQIFSEKNPQSNIVATVSLDKGKVETQHCFNTHDDAQWCKIVYTQNGVNINGFSDKKSLDAIAQRANTKSTFEKSYGGRYSEEGNAILPLSDGFLLVGKTESFGKGQDDAYVVKVDNFGNKIWSGAYGGGGVDSAKAVVEVDDGFILGGTTRSFGNRIQSLYLAKISKDGNLRWQKGYYSDKDDYYIGNDMIKISDNNLLIAGYEDHVKFFDSEINFYLNAINTDGQRNGIKRYGGNKVEKANSIISVSDGYVLAGETDTWGNGGKDSYVIKLNKDGDRIWHNAFGFRYDEVANQIIQTKDGGYIIVGTTDSDHRNQKDIYVVKIDKDGNKVWQYHYGSKEHEEGNGIVEVDDGYVIVGYTNETHSYNSDVYLLKIDKVGNVVWTRNYGGDRDDKGHALAKVKDGFVVTGYITSKDNNSKDLYLLKVDNNGNIN